MGFYVENKQPFNLPCQKWYKAFPINPYDLTWPAANDNKEEDEPK